MSHHTVGSHRCHYRVNIRWCVKLSSSLCNVPICTLAYSIQFVSEYNYHNSVHYPSSCLLFKKWRSRNWILSPSSGETYSVRTTLRRRQNPVSGTSCFKYRAKRWIMSRIVRGILIYYRQQTYRSYLRQNVSPIALLPKIQLLLRSFLQQDTTFHIHTTQMAKYMLRKAGLLENATIIPYGSARFNGSVWLLRRCLRPGI
jgi:hypothetical protein